jgi:precorrin-6B methylase 2
LERSLVKKSLGFLNLKEGDSFLDIGSGDGAVVLYAARNYPQAKFFKGIERIHLLFFVSQVKRLFSKYRGKILFERNNAFKHDYSKFNKVYIYMLPEFLQKFMPILEKQLPSGAIVVSTSFRIPDDYKKTGKLEIHEEPLGKKVIKIYVWEKK